MSQDDFLTPMNMPDIGKIVRQQEERANRLAGRLDAEDLHKSLMQRVRAFERNLGDDEEIGIKLANFGEAAQLHIRMIDYQNPNLIIFHGVNHNDHKTTLVQHISQLNFLLIAVKAITEEPYRIGFR